MEMLQKYPFQWKCYRNILESRSRIKSLELDEYRNGQKKHRNFLFIPQCCFCVQIPLICILGIHSLQFPLQNGYMTGMIAAFLRQYRIKSDILVTHDHPYLSRLLPLQIFKKKSVNS